MTLNALSMTPSAPVSLSQPSQPASAIPSIGLQVPQPLTTDAFDAIGMTETVALSPPRPQPLRRPELPQRLTSKGSDAAPPQDLLQEARPDLEAQRAETLPHWGRHIRLHEPLVASVAGACAPTAMGALAFGAFDRLQTLRFTSSCSTSAPDVAACMLGLGCGVALTCLSYPEASRRQKLELLTRRAFFASAWATVAFDVCRSVSATALGAEASACRIPTVFRSAGSAAITSAVAMQLAWAPAEALYALGRTAGQPLYVTGRALGCVTRRVWRRRWH